MNEELRRVHAELESARSEILARNEEVATTNEELKVIRAELDELAAINRRQNEFLVTLAHELRNPLAVLNSSSEVLGLAKGDAAAVSATQVMMKGQISHMSCMIDDLLDVSRITSGKVELRLEPLDLARLVREYCDSMRAPLEAKGVELSVDLPEHGIVIAGDAVRIEQILGNLLSNATKFSPGSGRIVVSLRTIDEASEEGEESALLSVSDQGIGLSPDALPKVFEPFTQAGRSSGSLGGLGVGLALVRHLVEFHGGTVDAFSEGLGRGTRFDIRFPLSQDVAAPTAAPEDTGSDVESVKRVLVVDDNVHAADSLAVLLHLAGHEVRTVYNGEAALDAAVSFEPDAILLDLGLPGMNGYEVARRLRRLPQRKPWMLLALTGYGQDEDRRRSAQAGIDRHLLKPVDLEQLQASFVELAIRPRRIET